MKSLHDIPGWPRGRSTSRPCAAGSVWPWEYVFNLATMDLIGVFPRTEWHGLSRRPVKLSQDAYRRDIRYQEDFHEFQAEERRKADMMEAFYRSQRIAAGWWPHS